MEELEDDGGMDKAVVEWMQEKELEGIEDKEESEEKKDMEAE